MRKLIITATAALALMACNNSGGGSFKLNINFPDETANGQTVYLTNYDSGDTVAQGVVAGQNATIEGQVADSYMARLLVDGKRANLIVEAGEITLNIQDGKATGTPLNEALNVIDQDIQDIADAVPENADADQEQSATAKIIDRFHKAYEDNKDNGIGPWAFNNYLLYNEFSVEQLDSVLSRAPERYRNLNRVKKAVNAAKQLVETAVGKHFTDFTDATGVKLSDFAGNGKYTLVDFWASWCGPCRRAMGSIKKLHETYKDKMNFVGVAVWDKPDDTAKAIEQLGISWPVMQGGENWAEPTTLYGVNGIPHIMIISPDGVIVARQLSAEQLEQVVKDLKI